MNQGERLNIVFIGNRQAGIIGAITALAKGHTITTAVAYNEDLKNVLESLSVEVCGHSVKNERLKAAADQADVLLSVHGREIVKPDLLERTRFGGINAHPYLYKYKGADPVGRAFRDGEYNASVGVHRMVEKVDAGEVLVEEFVDVSDAQSVLDIYNRLYPYYSIAVGKALDIVSKRLREDA